jgi:type 1 glutamine amidotransferase
LKSEGCAVDRTTDVQTLADGQLLGEIDLVVPVLTMAEPPEQGFAKLLDAVEQGLGVAGCHGGMCDAFRSSTDWHFLTGGQFVAHPGDLIDYRVTIKDTTHEITTGVSDFDVHTEQYYLHVDPAIRVLAESTPSFPGPHLVNPSPAMPVAWTRNWGQGRIFYLALGHSIKDLQVEQASSLLTRGMRWSIRQAVKR